MTTVSKTLARHSETKFYLGEESSFCEFEAGFFAHAQNDRPCISPNLFSASTLVQLKTRLAASRQSTHS